jgi:hypothetical protein
VRGWQREFSRDELKAKTGSDQAVMGQGQDQHIVTQVKKGLSSEANCLGQRV